MAATLENTTQSWRDADRRHHLHPFTDHRQLRDKGTRVITRAKGVYLWDSDGNQLLDAMAGLWCVNIGYGRDELADVAAEQMRQLPYYNTFFQSAHPPVIELAELVADITPEGFNQVFFTNSGSESNDTVVRMVRHYWASLDKPEKRVIVSRKNAYHGSTMAGASLGGMQAMHAQGGLPIPDIVHIDQPYWFGEGRLHFDDPQAFGLAMARQLETKIEELGEDTVAAFIAEPIQGAGGVIIPPASYWPEIQRICSDHDVLLIADEVICGFGRTGNWFGSQTMAIHPDIMPIAKGLSSGYQPIGGVVLQDAVADVLVTAGGEFAHGYTYSGHPVACAVAKRNIEIIRDEGLVDKVGNDTGPYLQKKWAALADHPLVGEARGIGFLGALELVANKTPLTRFDAAANTGMRCRDICASNGLVMRAVGDSMIISPPLIMTRAEIDELVEKVWKCLDLTRKSIS